MTGPGAPSAVADGQIQVITTALVVCQPTKKPLPIPTGLATPGP
jgi:hypothetical protein